jgi:hypothetical protein
VLLVVVLGYAVGHALWARIVGPGGAEVAGWISGLLLLAVATGTALALWRSRPRR